MIIWLDCGSDDIGDKKVVRVDAVDLIKLLIRVNLATARRLNFGVNPNFSPAFKNS